MAEEEKTSVSVRDATLMRERIFKRWLSSNRFDFMENHDHTPLLKPYVADDSQGTVTSLSLVVSQKKSNSTKIQMKHMNRARSECGWVSASICG